MAHGDFGSFRTCIRCCAQSTSHAGNFHVISAGWRRRDKVVVVVRRLRREDEIRKGKQGGGRVRYSRRERGAGFEAQDKIVSARGGQGRSDFFSIIGRIGRGYVRVAARAPCAGERANVIGRTRLLQLELEYCRFGLRS